MGRPYSEKDVFKAISDPIRRDLLRALSTGEKSVTDLLEPFDVSMPALSKHLQVLKDVELVTQKRNGRKQMYRLNAKPLQEVSQWLSYFEQFWDKKLDNLALYLEQRSKKRNG